MEWLSLPNFLIAGLIEVFFLDLFLSMREAAPLIGRGLFPISVPISTIIVIIAAIACSIKIVWWYFAFTILLYLIVGIANVVVYPIILLITNFLWSMFGPPRYVISPEYDVTRGQIAMGGILSLLYTLGGGGYLLYLIFCG